ncbi:MAG: ATP-binding cassette domain-containing protein [Pseudomonadota bacterium]
MAGYGLAMQLSAPSSLTADPVETVLDLSEIDVDMRGKPLFRGLSARFARGEMTLIVGAAGSGKSRLAALLSRTISPDRGQFTTRGAIAPVIGQYAGLGETATLERDLGLRAAAHGLDTRQYVDEVARIIGNPAAIRKPFEAASGSEKGLIGRASALLVPASVYISDNAALTAGEPGPFKPLFARRRREAAMIWISGVAGSVMQAKADRFMVLGGGRLHHCASATELLDVFEAYGGAVTAGVRRAVANQNG